jgi:hypothetical protein
MIQPISHARSSLLRSICQQKSGKQTKERLLAAHQVALSSKTVSELNNG